MKLGEITHRLEQIDKKERAKNKPNIIQYLKVGKIKRNQVEGVFNDGGEKSVE